MSLTGAVVGGVTSGAGGGATSGAGGLIGVISAGGLTVTPCVFIALPSALVIVPSLPNVPE